MEVDKDAGGREEGNDPGDDQRTGSDRWTRNTGAEPEIENLPIGNCEARIAGRT